MAAGNSSGVIFGSMFICEGLLEECSTLDLSNKRQHESCVHGKGKYKKREKKVKQFLTNNYHDIPVKSVICAPSIPDKSKIEVKTPLANVLSQSRDKAQMSFCISMEAL